MAIGYIELMSGITSSLPPLPIAEMGTPALTPLGKPLRDCRVMVVSSAGVHLDADPPFKQDNDMSFRRIPHSVSPTSSGCPTRPPRVVRGRRTSTWSTPTSG